MFCRHDHDAAQMTRREGLHENEAVLSAKMVVRPKEVLFIENDGVSLEIDVVFRQNQTVSLGTKPVCPGDALASQALGTTSFGAHLPVLVDSCPPTLSTVQVRFCAHGSRYFTKGAGAR